VVLNADGISNVRRIGEFRPAFAPSKDASAIGTYIIGQLKLLQESVILPVFLCGLIGWGNMATSNHFMRVTPVVLAALLIPLQNTLMPQSGYNIIDNLAAKSVSSSMILGLVLLLGSIVVSLLLHVINLFVSMPVTLWKRAFKKYFFYQQREVVYVQYVRNLLKDFRWARAHPQVLHPRHAGPTAVPTFSGVLRFYVHEAKCLVHGMRHNVDAFFVPVRLQVRSF